MTDLLSKETLEEIKNGRVLLMGESKDLAATALHFIEEFDKAIVAFRNAAQGLLVAEAQLAELGKKEPVHPALPEKVKWHVDGEWSQVECRGWNNAIDACRELFIAPPLPPLVPDEIINASQRLVDRYIANKGTELEFICCITPEFSSIGSGGVWDDWRKLNAALSACRAAQTLPIVPDAMLCNFYEVSSYPDLVRELVLHVEQLQEAAKHNVKPWQDTFPATLLPAYIERIKQDDDACRVTMLQLSGNSEQVSYPERLPCSVTLNPRLTIGKGCPTSTLLLALRRRAEREAELEAMTPDERKAHSDAIEAFKREFLPQADYPVIPEGWALVPIEPTDEMIVAGDEFMDGCAQLSDAYSAMIAAAPHPVKGDA